MQEYRAERAIAALKALAAPPRDVLRDGQIVSLPARSWCPATWWCWRPATLVPADLRLLEAVQLKVEEAALTGESVPVEKQARALARPDLPLGDRRNMAYKGTLVTHGRGRGVVVATGMDTELGDRHAAARRTKARDAAAEAPGAVRARLSLAVLAICALVFASACCAASRCC